MIKLIDLKGRVTQVRDETIIVPVKDKDGVPTGQTAQHRVITIGVLVSSKDGKDFLPLSVNSFDPAPGFKVPREGDEYEIPSKFRAVEWRDMFPKISL